MRGYKDLFQQYTDQTPEIHADVLAAIHGLDLDTIVPLAKSWPQDWRCQAELLLAAAADTIRALVAEVVVLDRELNQTETRLERALTAAAAAQQSATEAVEVARARYPEHGNDAPPIAAAARVAYRLALGLDPAPGTMSFNSYDHTPAVTVFGGSSLTGWASAFGVPVVLEEGGPTGSATATTTVDGVTVTMHGTVRQAAARPALGAAR